jgi:hypothetical protein
MSLSDAEKARIRNREIQILGVDGTRRPCPGKSGPCVYVWNKREDWPTYVRTLVTRSEVEELWGNYGDAQKRYNRLDNCWDLCAAFGDYDEDSDIDDDLVPLPPPPPSGLDVIEEEEEEYQETQAAGPSPNSGRHG